MFNIWKRDSIRTYVHHDIFTGDAIKLYQTVSLVLSGKFKNRLSAVTEVEHGVVFFLSWYQHCLYVLHFHSYMLVWNIPEVVFTFVFSLYLFKCHEKAKDVAVYIDAQHN